jgi:6-phospho-beta-glucosidase
MKITVIGGGGFRAPIVWESLTALAQQVPVNEMVLHDLSSARLSHVAAVIEGLRRERDGGPSVRTTTDLVDAIDGADVIFCAIRVGGLAGRAIDEAVPLRLGVLGQETVGPGGISFALRTIPVMLDIARVTSERAPRSWFLNFTNPAGLVTEALRPVLGDRVIGICDSPHDLFARVAAALGRARDELQFDYAGLNHLGWLLAIDDGGSDRLPELLDDDAALAQLQEANLFGVANLRRWRLIPNEYLIYLHSPDAIVAALRRAGATRAEVLLRAEATFYGSPTDRPADALAAWRRARDMRFATYMAEVRHHDDSDEPGDPDSMDEDSPEGPGHFGYAAIAAAFARAVTSGTSEALALNVANRGRLANLDDEAVVEVSCAVDTEGAVPLPGRSLPAEQADLVTRIKTAERLTIDAATHGRRASALDALAAHPVVPSRPMAERILKAYLQAFPELAGRLK